MPAATRIVQISDMHIFADKNAELLGVKTHESLSALVDLLKKDKTPPQLILLSGDLSQDRSQASYLHVAEIFAGFEVPIYCFPGNHDDGKLMTHFFPHGSIVNLKNIIAGHWQLILLDSQKHGAVEGYLDETQLEFMQECLQKHPDHHAIISFHHQPVPVGSRWLDNLGLTNADQLWAILKNYPRVQNILFGHVHQEYVGQKHGVNLYSTPSTCIQFKTQSDEFALEKLPPAYRWVDLNPDGTLTTGVVRCPHYVGVFDPNAKGY